MLDPKNKTTVIPFVVAYQETGTQANKLASSKPGKGKAHPGKEAATRAVLNRIVARVKRI